MVCVYEDPTKLKVIKNRESVAMVTSWQMLPKTKKKQQVPVAINIF